MITINDELLNKYLDDELNLEEKDLVKTAVENTPELKEKYAALLNAHSLLKNIEPDSPNLNFTKLIMNKISSKTMTARQQKYFLFSILSFFGFIVLGITGYLLFQIISSMQASESTEAITTYSKGIGDYFSNLFGQKNISIFGSILSFIMLVSGYFLFEYQKKFKKNFGH